MPPLGLQVRHLAHRPDAVDQGADGGDVVGQHRHADPEAEGKDTGHADDIRHDDHAPTAGDVAIQSAGDVAKFAQLAETLLQENDVGGVGGNGRGAAQRDGDVGFLEGNGIVDAVADEADLAALGLQFLHIVGLVGRQHLGEVPVHAEFLGQLFRRRLMIAGNDGQMLDAPLPKALDDVLDLGPQRRAKFQSPAQFVVDADHDHRVAIGMHGLQLALDLGRDGDALHLHVAPAADTNHVSIDADADAIAHLILGIVGGWQIQAHFLGLVQNRQRDGMVEFAFGGRGIQEDVLRLVAIGRDDLADFGALTGQRSGLVEQDRVDLVHQFQRAAVLDQNAFLRAERQ